MKKKPEIYREILSDALCLCRNLQSRSCISKAMDKTTFLELDFIHNIIVSMFDTEFTDHDIWFLNNQAYNYLEKSNESLSPNYHQHKNKIKELLKILPESKRQDIHPQLLELIK